MNQNNQRCILKKLNRLLSLVFVFNASSVFADAGLSWQDECLVTQCRAIIDAGSSGSRLYVYAQDKIDNSQWHVLFQKKVVPGLSAVSVDAVPQYLNQLMTIKPSTQMPIDVYGTAGMRLLSNVEQDKRYQAVQQWFYQHGEWSLQHARTISGQEEGAFAWISVQNQMSHQNPQNQVLPAVVEIGGASAQISVPVSEKEAKRFAEKDIYKLQFNQKTIYLWSKSYLGLGINEVEKQFKDKEQCYSIGYPLSNGTVGQGDISLCSRQLMSNADLSLLKRLKDAKQVVSQHAKLPWVALGAIRFSVLNPPFRFEQQTFSLSQLQQQGDDLLCHQDWQLLHQTLGSDQYLYRGCFAASYYYASLAGGVGINDKQSIYYPDANAQMDWTVGALLLS
jgi:hypothetical protein